MFKKLIVIALTLFAAITSFAAELNKATQAELESISGIGPSMSNRILEERKKSSFKDWPDFATRVKGVGQKKAAKFSQAGLTVNGSGFDGSSIGAAKGSKPSKKTSEGDAPQVKVTKAKPQS